MRILLVEDDALIGEAVVVALRDAGHAIDWVRDGESAAAVVKDEDHQVVLLDLGLPGGGARSGAIQQRRSEGAKQGVNLARRDGERYRSGVAQHHEGSGRQCGY